MVRQRVERDAQGIANDIDRDNRGYHTGVVERVLGLNPVRDAEPWLRDEVRNFVG